MIIKLDFDGKEVSFCTSFAWSLRYEAQFHRDAMKDLAPAMSGDIYALSMTTIVRVAWAAASLCDSNIEPDVEKWVMSFGDDFNYETIVTEVIAPVLEASIASKKSEAPTAEEAGAKK